MKIEYTGNDTRLTAPEYVALFTSVWRKDLDVALVERALSVTTNVTAREGERLIACARIMTDGYLFSVVTEVVMHPDYWNASVARAILELAFEMAPTGLTFGSQATDEEIMRDIGWERGPATYFRKKLDVPY